ncbi:MAG TPA: FecR domain-containing protein [Puia sp.]|nr:FecR domain-containing protein [Puia sp.]
MDTAENRFITLLDKHLTGNATAAEVTELLQLIRSGQFDQLLGQRIDHALLNTPADRNMSPESAQQLLHKILSAEAETNQLIAPARRVINYRSAVSAAAALLIIVAAGWLLWPSSPKELAKIETPAPAARPDTTKGKFMHLPDGSTVLLHGGSRLAIAKDFNAGTREVTLSGEGYFDIRRDDNRPFIVHAKTVNTTVLGTTFNVRAWPGQPAVVVTVTDGKVKVTGPQRTYGIIGSNEQIAIDSATDRSIGQRINADAALSWKKEYLILDDISLIEAVRLIENKYGVKITLAKDAPGNCRISATFLAHESLQQVLAVVSAVTEGVYTTRPDGSIVISGKGSN